MLVVSAQVGPEVYRAASFAADPCGRCTALIAGAKVSSISCASAVVHSELDLPLTEPVLDLVLFCVPYMWCLFAPIFYVKNILTCDNCSSWGPLVVLIWEGKIHLGVRGPWAHGPQRITSTRRVHTCKTHSLLSQSCLW